MASILAIMAVVGAGVPGRTAATPSSVYLGGGPAGLEPGGGEGLATRTWPAQDREQDMAALPQEAKGADGQKVAAASGAQGDLGPWLGASRLNTPRQWPALAQAGSYLYAMGGYGSSGYLNSVERAQILADGSLGAWQVLTGTLTTGRQYAAAVATGGYLYVVGGYGSSGRLSSVERARANADGSLGSWSVVSNMSEGRQGPGVAAVGGYLYAIGGYPSSGLPTSGERALINPDGSLGAWQATTSLATGRGRLGLVAAGGYLYAIGGHGIPGYLSSVERAAINPDGSLATWEAASSLASGRYDLGAVATEDFIYVVGGYGSGGYLDTVEYARLKPLLSVSPTAMDFRGGYTQGSLQVANAGGGVLTWSASRPASAAWLTIASGTGVITATVSRSGQATGIYTSTITVTSNGGEAAVPVTMIVGLVEGDGSLGPWLGASRLNTPRQGPALAQAGSYLYAMSGASSSSSYLNTVERAQILADGSLGAWQVLTGTLTTGRQYAAAVASGGYLYVIGGYRSSGDLSSGERAAINADGSLGAWQATSSLATARYNLGLVAYGGYLYAIGGTGPLSSVERARVNADGSLGGWSVASNMGKGRRGPGVAAVGGYLYAIGGYSSSGQESSGERAPINPDGSLGAWQVTSSLATARYYLGLVASGGYLYVLGGYGSSGNLSSVERAAINPDGSLGAWQATSSLATARRELGAVATEDFVYVVGGYRDNWPYYLDTVEFARLKPLLSVSPTAMDLGSRYSQASLYIFNSGGGGPGALSWSLDKPVGATWLTITPTVGLGDGVLDVSVVRTGSSAGVYSTTVTITSTGGTVSYPVSMEVAAPEVLPPGGAAWTDLSGPTQEPLYSISMVSATDGWAVGGTEGRWSWESSRGVILHFDGSSWRSVDVLDKVYGSIIRIKSLRGVSMVSANEGWAVGAQGTILRFNRSAWEEWPKTPAPTVENLRGVAMVSADNGWAVGDSGTILHFDGSSWDLFASPVSARLNAVQMLSAGEGWAVGTQGTILRFDGTAWTKVASPTSADLYSIHLLAGKGAYAVGSAGTILSYNGTAWQVQSSPVSLPLYAVRVVDTSDVWAAGGDEKSSVLLHYNGSTWHEFSRPVPTPLYTLHIVSLTEGWAMGSAGRILRYNWTSWGSYYNPVNVDLRSVHMLFSDYAWVVGNGGTILRWNGAGWLVEPSPTTVNLQSVHATSRTEAWAVGDSGTILHYTGSAWSVFSQRPVTVTSSLRSVFMVSPSEGWAVGDGGTILRYRQGGWSLVSSPTTDNLNSVYFTSPSDGWAVGDNGRLLHYQSGSWSLTSRPTSSSLRGVYMLSSSDVWAVGDNGITIHYNGAVWKAVSSGVDFSLRSVFMVAPSDGWAVGGTWQRRDPIIRYTGAWGIVSMNTEVPNLLSIGMASAKEGWAVGERGALLHYTSTGEPTPPTPTPPTPTPTPTPTPVPGQPTRTPTPTPTPTRTPTPGPTPTPTRTPTPGPTPTPTRTPTPTVRLPRPFVQSIEPSTGTSDRLTNVVIKGSNFQSNPTIKVEKTLQDVSWVSSSKLIGVIPAGLLPGAYDVVVINPDGQQTALLGGFRVIGLGPTLTEIVPVGGSNDAPNDVSIFGFNFALNISMRLGDRPLPNIVRRSSTWLEAVVPTTMPPGTWDLTATNPGVSESATLKSAYTVIDVTSDDLYMEAADIWTDPVTVREESPVNLGANVRRRGGKSSVQVPVKFYLGDPQAGGTLIGSSTTPPLNPRGVDSTYVTWNVGSLHGDVNVYAVIDPDGTVSESNKSNNKVSRVVSVLPPAADTAPPKITSFQIREGENTTSQQITVQLSAQDDPSGGPPTSMYLVEREFNTSARQWVAIQQTGWIPYASEYAFNLSSRGGLRYIQAWVSDAAGNISVETVKERTNFVPASDEVLQNQVRIYRQRLSVGGSFTAVLETLSGDADLYVWNPSATRSWVSNLSGTERDQVTVKADVEGVYQIEVFGYQDSRYTLTITGGAAALGIEENEGKSSISQVKTRREEPSISPSYEPEGKIAVPKAVAGGPISVYIPFLSKSASSGW